MGGCGCEGWLGDGVLHEPMGDLAWACEVRALVTCTVQLAIVLAMCGRAALRLGYQGLRRLGLRGGSCRQALGRAAQSSPGFLYC